MHTHVYICYINQRYVAPIEKSKVYMLYIYVCMHIYVFVWRDVYPWKKEGRENKGEKVRLWDVIEEGDKLQSVTLSLPCFTSPLSTVGRFVILFCFLKRYTNILY